MAISGTTYAQTSFRIAIAQEATFGTPIATQASFYELDIVSPTQPDMASGVVEDYRKRSDGKRVNSRQNWYRSTVGGMYVIPFECIVTAETGDLLISAALQDLTSEGATTPYDKIWDWDEATTGPDFSADAGKFFTVIGYDPAEDWAATSCVIRNMTFSSSPGTNGGRLTASGEFVTGFDIDITPEAAVPASWVATSPGTEYFPFQLYTTCTASSADLVPYSFSLTVNNGAVRVGHDSSGDAQSYFMEFFDVTAEIVAKLDANTKNLLITYRLNPATNGASDNPVVMAWGAVGSKGGLQFTMNGVLTAPNTRDFGQESGVGVTLSYAGSDDTTSALEVKMTNTIDRSWH